MTSVDGVYAWVDSATSASSTACGAKSPLREDRRDTASKGRFQSQRGRPSRPILGTMAPLIHRGGRPCRSSDTFIERDSELGVAKRGRRRLLLRRSENLEALPRGQRGDGRRARFYGSVAPFG